jgi:hypothetical protein
MQLLISTPLHLLLLDPITRETSTIRSGDGYYYGITVKNHQIVLTHTGGYLQYFHDRTKPCMTVSNLVQPHQVEWIDDKVVVANTGRNCLSIFDAVGNFCEDVYLNSIHFDDKEKNRSGNHFNSVHREGDKIYVVAHNYDRPSEVWILSWPDLRVLNHISTGAGWAHNIWIGEYGTVICDSKNGGLYEVSSDQTIWRSDRQPVMTRGLAVSPDYIFIGRSLHNRRKERFWKDGGVWILDRRTLRIVDDISLPGAGDVHEIRLIGSTDACHNDQVFSFEDLALLKSVSPMVQLAYGLRKSYPSLRRDFFPMSQVVRGAQIVRRWWFSRLRRSGKTINA